ncbi:hypothetical protein LOTGIDRAFT_197057 [Lottia gigantea]|uniref:Mitotic spindle assembly checkpoint protein MAD2B n=1 Tax=Lottia gigantea TaxID=225164 RepID=V3ZHD3_LOTGI|nr:hypothetical protein LOTGIDRAFT_197057 [Lottia gigantea]ESO83602.1 hypothetical protein LOTGIDRAFT_197057 [Lottia gigantea]
MEAVNRYQVSADILSEFLEVAIHGILYNRSLYPHGVFQRRKKYNVPIQVCLHPDVTIYISRIVESCKILLETGEIEKIVIIILSSDNFTPLERFSFEIAHNVSHNKTSDEYLFEMEASLRSFLLKLTVCDAMLKPLPEDCTWTVHIHTRDSAVGKIEEKQTKDFPWIEAEESQTVLKDPLLVPLRAMKSDYFKLQLFVEETGEKGQMI